MYTHERWKWNYKSSKNNSSENFSNTQLFTITESNFLLTTKWVINLQKKKSETIIFKTVHWKKKHFLREAKNFTLARQTNKAHE